MLKITGGIMVIAASFLIGLLMRKEMKEECEFTEHLINGFNAVKEEIRYNPDYLLNSISKAALFSGAAKSFFDIVHLKMQSGSTAENAFSDASADIKNEKIRSIILDTAKLIGKTDSEGQQNLLMGCVEKLKILHSQQNELFKERGSMHPKLGAVTGILITILLF